MQTPQLFKIHSRCSFHVAGPALKCRTDLLPSYQEAFAESPIPESFRLNCHIPKSAAQTEQPLRLSSSHPAGLNPEKHPAARLTRLGPVRQTALTFPASECPPGESSVPGIRQKPPLITRRSSPRDRSIQHRRSRAVPRSSVVIIGVLHMVTRWNHQCSWTDSHRQHSRSAATRRRSRDRNRQCYHRLNKLHRGRNHWPPCRSHRNAATAALASSHQRRSKTWHQHCQQK